MITIKYEDILKRFLKTGITNQDSRMLKRGSKSFYEDSSSDKMKEAKEEITEVVVEEKTDLKKIEELLKYSRSIDL